MLEIITSATSKQLTTVTAIKAELGITDTTQDALLGSLIDQASDAIADYCGRPFAREVYKETIPGHGSNRLVLNRTPIVSVASVVADSEIILDYLIEDPGAGILYRKTGWRWTPPIGWNITYFPLSGQEELLFAVQYAAGYLLPADTGRTLPQSIEKACIETVKLWYLGRDRDQALASEKFGDLQSNYNQVQGFPPSAVQLLVPWRRII